MGSTPSTVVGGYLSLLQKLQSPSTPYGNSLCYAITLRCHECFGGDVCVSSGAGDRQPMGALDSLVENHLDTAHLWPTYWAPLSLPRPPPLVLWATTSPGILGIPERRPPHLWISTHTTAGGLPTLQKPLEYVSRWGIEHISNIKGSWDTMIMIHHGDINAAKSKLQ